MQTPVNEMTNPNPDSKRRSYSPYGRLQYNLGVQLGG